MESPRHRAALAGVSAGAEVLATAKASGGAVVFAHPTVYKSMPLVRELAAEGAIDGIEVDHPSNSPEDHAECVQLCREYGLVPTAGTDFHGRNHKVPHPIGHLYRSGRDGHPPAGDRPQTGRRQWHTIKPEKAFPL